MSDSSRYINGTVYENTGSGNVTVANGVVVWVTCARPDGFLGYTWGTTDSQGFYSLYLAGSIQQNLLECNSFGSRYTGFNVTLENVRVPQVYDNTLVPGYFNETIFVWNAQNVSFYLPKNFVSPYFPAVLDFSNAVGGASTISFTQAETESYTTTLSESWNLGAGGGGLSGTSSDSTVNSYTAGGGVKQVGGTLDYVVQQMESGTVAFSAFNRTWAQTAIGLYGAYLNGQPAGQVPGFHQPSDWMTPQNFTSKNLYYATSGLGKVMDAAGDNVSGFFYTGSITTQTTTESSGGYSLSFTLSASLPGVGSASFGMSAGWSQTSSTTYTNTLDWEVGVPPGGSSICIDVFGQGGSGTYADVIGIYVWPYSPSCT